MAYAANQSFGVATTTSTKPTRASSFRWAGRAVDRRVAVEVQLVAVRAAHYSALLSSCSSSG